MDIASWLHSLGLPQYEKAFRDNAIDMAVLPELTTEDLKDLGVSLVGHRRRLLGAIAALRNEGNPEPVAKRRVRFERAPGQNLSSRPIRCPARAAVTPNPNTELAAQSSNAAPGSPSGDN